MTEGGLVGMTGRGGLPLCHARRFPDNQRRGQALSGIQGLFLFPVNGAYFFGTCFSWFFLDGPVGCIISLVIMYNKRLVPIHQ